LSAGVEAAGVYRRSLLAATALLAGCGARPPLDEGTATGTATATRDRARAGVGPSDVSAYGFVHVRADGNRLVPGRAAVPEADPVDVSLPAPADWLVAAPVDGGDATVWAATLADGRRRAYRLADGRAERLSVAGDATGAPLLAVTPDGPRLLGGVTPLAPPAPVPTGLAAVRRDGRLSLVGRGLDLAAPPDARVVAGDGRLFVLADATEAYGHGALGDEVEAETVAVVDPASGVVRRLSPPTGVIEGLAPILADVDGDGDREVVVTASDEAGGARLVALRPGGGVAATGPPVGTGFRWRHQIAVAPFGPGGETEAVAVRTPHLGGTAEFYRADGDRLRIVARRAGGYASHRLGSRNLGMAVAGDLDGDGRVELLVPGPDGRLVALRRVPGGVEPVWSVPAAGLRTNLAAARGPGGTVLGAGLGERLRLWPAR
jgi:hypothetical protein